MRFIGRFFLWLFAVVGFLIVVVAVSLTTWFLISGEEEESLPPRIVLSLDLNDGVAETRPRSPLAFFSHDGPASLRDIIAGLRKAEDDERVAGLLVRLGSSGAGIAKAQEIRDAVARLRKAGKFAIAYADSFAPGPGVMSEYFLATGFDEIWMQPSGELATTGVAIQVPFVAGALGKIGVQARMEQRKQFKSAPETFMRENMSAPARSNLQDMVNSWFAQLTGGIGTGRNIPLDAARKSVNESPLLASEAVERKLVDTLDYWPSVKADAKKRGGPDADLVTLARYVGDGDLPFTSGPTVALIYGIGPIVSAGGGGAPFDDSQFFSARDVAAAIVNAVDDPAVKAILLRIDSPGGSYLASDTVWNAVMDARAKGKPVIASLGGVAASGGYFVAMAADKIVASPGTLTGSIGVYGGKFDTSALWPKLGVNWETVKAGDNAEMWSPFHGFSPEAKARLDRTMDAVYEDFTGKLAKGRNLSPAQVESVAGGRIWSGDAARKVGLVDHLGGLSTAIEVAKVAAGLKPTDTVKLTEFPKPKTPLERLMMLMAEEGGNISAWVIDALGLRGHLERAVAARMGPLMDELDALRPPVGRLQMPPLKVRH
jgi:protease-4